MAAHALPIYIGYDPREPLPYHVLSHSILTRASIPVALIPVARHSLRWYTRPRAPIESTDFSISRFLVPFLQDYRGWAVFMDCDMLCRVDVAKLLEEILAQRTKGVLVCQHDYTPSSSVKFLNQPQTVYPRKNWSSFMVFNTGMCRHLSPDYVNTATGLDLHRFEWMPDEFIGSLPLEWNWLVGEYERNDQAKFLHYTIGGPWFEEYKSCDHADLWWTERIAMDGAGAALGLR